MFLNGFIKKKNRTAHPQASLTSCCRDPLTSGSAVLHLMTSLIRILGCPSSDDIQVIFEIKLPYFQAEQPHSCHVILKMLHCVCDSEPLIKRWKTYDGAELVFFVHYAVSFSGKQSPRISGNFSATNIFYV